MIADFFKLAIATLIHRKLRSILTVLGIVIGITAVVALVSLGRGLQGAVNEQFNAIGSSLIFIQPGGMFAPASSTATGSAKLTESDLDIISRIDGVSNTLAMLVDVGKIEFNSKTHYGYVMGIPDDPSTYGSVGNVIEIVQGRQFKPGDTNKVLIGNDFANKDINFDKKLRIGDRISIEDATFYVIGVRKKTGDPSDDQGVIIPIETHRDIFNIGDRYAVIYAEVANGYIPDRVAEKIKKELRDERNQEEGEEDFQVQTSEELIASFNTILTIVQAVIVGIAAISLIVGGVGIMNTMYTSVLERTKDIGILKSIGAKDSDILILFLMESGLIGLIGGIIGITLGIGLGKLVEFAALQIWGTPLIKAEFPMYLIIGALLFSFVVGSIAGLLPARQAAQKNPVDALRYE